MGKLLEELKPEITKELHDKDLINILEARGFQVTHDQVTSRVIDLRGNPTGSVRFGITSDNHLGSRYQQLSHLNDFYNKAAEFGIDFMLNGGDLCDGQNMHRDQQYEIFKHGVDAQAKYIIDALPVARTKTIRGNYKTVPTYGIGGNHDGSGWNDAGANVLGQVADSRNDYHFLGAPTALFMWGPLKIMVMHPDGGPSYARSYRLQKIVEGFEPDSKPHILLCGHWHVQCHVSTRNVEAYCVPCFQAQTPYLKRKGLTPVIGGYLFEIEYNDLGPTSITSKFVRYANPIPHDYP